MQIHSSLETLGLVQRVLSQKTNLPDFLLFLDKQSFNYFTFKEAFPFNNKK